VRTTSPPCTVWSAPKREISSRRTSSVKCPPTGTTSGRRVGRGTIGSALAAWASAAVMAPSSAMRSSTQSRRMRAASGKRTGL
jgi:hypothetical protein